MSKFKLYFNSPLASQGQGDEDFIELAVDGDKMLVVHVHNGLQKSGEQFSVPPGLNAGDFQDINGQVFEGNVSQFQDLVNKYFSGVNVIGWLDQEDKSDAVRQALTDDDLGSSLTTDPMENKQKKPETPEQVAALITEDGTAEYKFGIGNLISANIIPSIKENRMRSPEDIAKLITEDIRTNNGLVESLFGHNVVDGDKPIDIFLGAIDRSYLDLDFNDPKVITIVKKVFGNVPSIEQFKNLITTSSQSAELQNEILSQLGPVKQGPATQSTMKRGDVNVEHVNGKVYKGVGVVDAGSYIYLMLDDVPGGWGRLKSGFSHSRRNWKKYSDVFEVKQGMRRQKGKFITIKKDNVKRVTVS